MEFLCEFHMKWQRLISMTDGDDDLNWMSPMQLRFIWILDQYTTSTTKLSRPSRPRPHSLSTYKLLVRSFQRTNGQLSAKWQVHC